METSRVSFRQRIKKILVLNQWTIAILVLVSFLLITSLVYLSQIWVERGALPPINISSPKEQYEIAKLAAEIRQVRSDTSGSLFWLKMIALFVTVGGAVGGYLLGQSRITSRKIDFEKRKNIDAVYQSMVQELSDKAPLLRAGAAVKLGAILKSFPYEWDVSNDRQEQLVQLTKQVLAAAMSIEKDPKVLKTLTIAIALHKRLMIRHWRDDASKEEKLFADLRELDLSAARATDAYWAKIDFTDTDFYRAHLARASFRQSILERAQFREADLQDAVLVETNCTRANFKLADLRRADLSNARLTETNFEGARVHGCIITGAIFDRNPEVLVDTSELGDGTGMKTLKEWRGA